MIKVKVHYTVREVILVVLFYLLLLQDVFVEQIPLLGYVDEGVAVLGAAILLFKLIAKENIVLKKSEIILFGGILVFVAAGAFSNVIYQYQQLLPVLKDIFTCLKFFLAIVVGMELIRSIEIEQSANILVWNSKLVAAALFVMLLMNILFGMFATNEERYGLPIVQLMFSHPTILAATAVFLLGILTLFYKRENNIFIIFSLVVLFFTLRSKAIAAVAVYLFMFLRVVWMRKKIGFVHLLLIAIIAVCLAWDQIYYYYFHLSDESARAMLTQTSFKILKDFFPLGTGFGTFASNVAAESYSQVYFEYGLDIVYGLRENNAKFASDTFWPIVIGQTGFIGTCGYVVAMIVIILRVMRTRKNSNAAYMAGMFIFGYLLISSTSESAFCNPMAIPLALVLGGVLGLERNYRYRDNE